MHRTLNKQCFLVALLVLGPSIFFGCLADRASHSRSPIELTPPEILVADLFKTVPTEGSLKTIAALQVNTRSGAYPLKLAILLKRPSLMRAEAIAVLGPPHFLLSIRENRLKVLLPEKNEFYAGPATPENVALFLPFRIDAESVVSLLMGIPPAIHGKNRSLKGSQEGNLYRIDIHSEGRRVQSLWIRPSDGFLDGVEVLPDEKTSYRVKYDGHARVDGAVIPQKLLLLSEADGITVSIRYRDMEQAAEADDAFDLPIPPEMKPVYLP